MGTGGDERDLRIPRVTVEGTVVDAESGLPLEGVTVAYYFDPGEEYERKTPLRSAIDSGPHPMLGVPPTISDRKGRFRFVGIPFWPGASRKIGAGKPGWFPSSRTVEFSREGETLRVDLRLGRGAVLRGVARMADGTPAEGAEIFHFGSFGHHWRKPWEDDLYPCHRFHPDRMSVETGPDGRYELGPFPRGVSFIPMVSHPWGRPRRVIAVEVPEGALEVTRDIVFDPTGQVEVTLIPGRGPLPKDVHLDVRSADEPDEPGSGHGLGNLSGFPQASWIVHIPSVPSGKSILFVRTTNPGGPGAERRVPLAVRKGKCTRIRVPLPPAFSRRPWKPGAGEFHLLMDTPPRRTGRPTATVAGSVRDADTGAPIRGAWVSDVWRPSGEHLGSHHRQDYGVTSLEAPPVRTNSGGLFRLPRVPFEAGSARKVLIEAVGYWTTARVYEFSKVGGVLRWDIRLRRAGVLRGTVRDPAGRPRPGVDLFAYLRRGQEDDWETRHRAVCTDTSQAGSVRATTGTRGEFALSPLPFDRWIDINAGHGVGSGIPNMALALRAERPEARLDFVIDPGGTLVVEVRQPPGLPTRDITIELQRQDGDLVFSSGWGGGREPRSAEAVRSQAHQGVAPGDYLLVARAEGMRAPARPSRVRIRRGKTTTVRIRLRPKGTGE